MNKQMLDNPHHVFIPVTDEIIYDHPEQIDGPLVPYFAGMECQNWLSIELNPQDDPKLTNVDAHKTGTRKKALHRAKLQLVAG